MYYSPLYSQVKRFIENSNIYVDLKKNVVYDIVDYDKNYTGLQLVLDNNAIRFDSIPYRVVPMIYYNKLFGVDIDNSSNLKIVAPIQVIPDTETLAIQLGSAILPIAVDPKSVLKSKEAYQSEVFNLLWMLMSGKAGTTADKMLEYAKTHIRDFENYQKLDDPYAPCT